MNQAAAEIVELTRVECLELLAGQSLGRLAVIRDGRPLIFPVNYVLDVDTIVFRTDPGTKLSSAPLRNVAFEVDWVDPQVQAGWSVLVQGRGFEITRAIDEISAGRRRLPVFPMVAGEKPHWIQIEAEEITGRSFRPEPG